MYLRIEFALPKLGEAMDLEKSKLCFGNLNKFKLYMKISVHSVFSGTKI